MNLKVIEQAAEELESAADHAHKLAEALKMFLGCELKRREPVVVKEKKIKDTELKRKVYEAVLTSDKNINGSQIARILGKNQGTIWQTLKILQGEGKVKKDKDGYYPAPPNIQEQQ